MKELFVDKQLRGNKIKQMDIVHHGAIGAAGYVFLVGNDHFLAGTAFCAGSVIPDLDVGFMVFGKRVFLKNHQGPTHSLVMSPFIALAIGAPLMYLNPEPGFGLGIYAAALIGLWSHTFLDLTNTFGILLAWPLKNKRVSLDSVFFVDAFLWAWTFSYFALYYFLEDPGPIFPVYAFVFLAYLVFKFFLRKSVKGALGSRFVVPSALNPFEFYIMEEAESGIKTYLYNSLFRSSKNEEVHEYPDPAHKEMAQTSEVFEDVSRITKYLHITDVSEQGGGLAIEARDLAVRNFGGRFGRVTLKFNSDGELIDEVADI